MIYDKFLKYYYKYSLIPENKIYETKFKIYTDRILEQNGGNIDEINNLIKVFKEKIKKGRENYGHLRQLKDRLLKGLAFLAAETKKIKDELERIKNTANCSEADKKTIDTLKAEIVDLQAKLKNALEESSKKISAGEDSIKLKKELEDKEKEYNQQLESIKKGLTELTSAYDKETLDVDKEIKDILEIINKELDPKNLKIKTSSASPSSPKKSKVDTTATPSVTPSSPIKKKSSVAGIGLPKAPTTSSTASPTASPIKKKSSVAGIGLPKAPTAPTASTSSPSSITAQQLQSQKSALKKTGIDTTKGGRRRA